ncbi:MAG: YqeG family HAD IIIA-type phosphatase [Bacilli bacterium]|nr:YqeG family HAD IIIA-type phosphatase [Bacilli bacterium]
MSMFIPDMYKKNIFSINYKKLKEKGIKVLIFDFDNTLIEKGNYIVNDKTIKLFKDIKKSFNIYIVSNSIHESKLRKVCEKLAVPYIKGSSKPFKRGFKKLNLKDIKDRQIAMIGDQVLTDVLGSKRMNYFSILVDPINNDEWIATRFNRVIENIILKENKIKRGRYYD